MSLTDTLLTAQRLHDAGQFAAAKARYQEALALSPHHAVALHGLGVLAFQEWNNEQAVALLQQSLQAKPTSTAHLDLGNVLRDMGDQAAAEQHYREALALNPTNAGAHNNLGALLYRQGQKQAAIEHFRQALALDPQLAGVHSNLGCALKDSGDFASALQHFEQALTLTPHDPHIHSNLLFCAAHAGDLLFCTAPLAQWHAYLARYRDCLSGLPRYRQWRSDHDAERRLRIGFVSGDLREHAVAYFLASLWAEFDHDRLELQAYYTHSREDQVTQRLAARVTGWHNVAGLRDETLATRIHDDGIDILIDLSGHTAHNRLPVFARKPAPVQVSWLGFPGSTGLAEIDYFIADRALAPTQRSEEYFVEKLVRLPATAGFVPPADAPPVSPLPALKNGYFTFGAFHRDAKLGDPVIALWSRILQAVPNARLHLGGISDSGRQQQIQSRFVEHGIDPARLHFLPRVDLNSYLAQHHDIDLILDAFPYAGGTTTAHAAWMGVPVLTLAGETMPSRQGAAVNLPLGRPEFVVETQAAYVDAATSWPQQLQALSEIRLGLRAQMAASPVQQPGVLARAFASALREMWRRYCAGQPAVAFDVSLQGRIE